MACLALLVRAYKGDLRYGAELQQALQVRPDSVAQAVSAAGGAPQGGRAAPRCGPTLSCFTAVAT